MGEKVTSIADLPAAFERARACDRSYGIVIPVQAYTLLEGQLLVGGGHPGGERAGRSPSGPSSAGRGEEASAIGLGGPR
jgi:hypothetical protein